MLVILESIIKSAEKLIGLPLKHLEEIYLTQVKRKTTDIMNDYSHPAFGFFQYLPLGRRLKAFTGSQRYV